MHTVPPEDKWFYDAGRQENILGIDRDTPIYRVFQRKYLLDDVSRKQLSLPRVSFWEDPFEAFFFKTIYRSRKGHRVTLGGLAPNVHGMCWTLKAESDAIWRIYSPGKDNAIVQATVGKLFDALYGNGKNTRLSLFIGRVKYAQIGVDPFTDSFLANHLRRILPVPPHSVGDQLGIGIAEALLWKREEFEHEQEVRLISNSETAEAVEQFSIDPNQIFDKITADPRMCKDEFERLKAELTVAGFGGPIVKSQLYEPPTFEVNCPWLET